MWLWRGTQSAIFYYVSLSPCLEYNHKRRRRKEANRTHKERAELEEQQPGMIHQPVPFQTNQYWAEEIEAGPGPPRGWRKHSLDDGIRKAERRKKNGNHPKKSLFLLDRRDATNKIKLWNTSSSSDTAPQISVVQSAGASHQAPMTGAGSTLDAFKDTIRSTIARPDTWNWKQYEREDENLFGINDRLSRMWDRATSHGRQASTDHNQLLTPGRKRAATTDSDDYNWRYATNPGVNDMHPPIVSQLPRTRREVTWMMQPPPSRAVMEGKVRPGHECGNRRPLCTIGGNPVHPKHSKRRQEEARENMLSIVNNERAADIVVSPGGTDYAGNADDEEEDDTDTDTDIETEADGDDARKREANWFRDWLSSGYGSDADEENTEKTEASSFPDHLSSRNSPWLSSVKNALTSQPYHPRQASYPLQRPPLAVLVDPNHTTTRFRPYQLPIASAKPMYAQTPASPTLSAPRLPDLDVLLDIVLPQLPQRSRHSLPNVRLGETVV